MHAMLKSYICMQVMFFLPRKLNRSEIRPLETFVSEIFPIKISCSNDNSVLTYYVLANEDNNKIHNPLKFTILPAKSMHLYILI